MPIFRKRHSLKGILIVGARNTYDTAPTKINVMCTNFILYMYLLI